jgi:hypothetical protein
MFRSASPGRRGLSLTAVFSLAREAQSFEGRVRNHQLDPNSSRGRAQSAREVGDEIRIDCLIVKTWEEQ